MLKDTCDCTHAELASDSDKHETVSVQPQRYSYCTLSINNAASSDYDSKLDDVSQIGANSKIRAFIRRFGRTTVAALFLTAALEALIVSVLLFFWYGQPNNALWHTVMIRGWITRVTPVGTLLLRLAVGVQASCVAAIHR